MATIVVKETWKPISETNGRYEVSDYGRVRSNDGYYGTNMYGAKSFMRGRILIPSINHKGYFQLQITKSDKKRYTAVVHRLVALAFIPLSTVKTHLTVNHIDCDKTNNCIENLEWCTALENTAHAVENDRYSVITGINNKRAVLTNKDVLEIRELRALTKLTETAIAERYNVKRSAIASIIHSRTWKHI